MSVRIVELQIDPILSGAAMDKVAGQIILQICGWDWLVDVQLVLFLGPLRLGS